MRDVHGNGILVHATPRYPVLGAMVLVWLVPSRVRSKRRQQCSQLCKLGLLCQSCHHAVLQLDVHQDEALVDITGATYSQQEDAKLLLIRGDGIRPCSL